MRRLFYLKRFSKFVFQLRLETLAKNIYGKKAKFLIRGKKSININ